VSFKHIIVLLSNLFKPVKILSMRENQKKFQKENKKIVNNSHDGDLLNFPK